MSAKLELLESLIAPVAESLGCEFWGLDYIARPKTSLLRIYIDKQEGIDVKDCERVSRQVSAVMDVEDPIAGNYTLEVSSPGMDRPLYKLEQYAAYAGHNIKLKLRMAFEGRKNFTGLLKGVEDDEIVLQVDQEEYLLPYELIDKANVVPTF
jgi:ribosome maturation factor RimP